MSYQRKHPVVMGFTEEAGENGVSRPKNFRIGAMSIGLLSGSKESSCLLGCRSENKQAYHRPHPSGDFSILPESKEMFIR